MNKNRLKKIIREEIRNCLVESGRYFSGNDVKQIRKPSPYIDSIYITELLKLREEGDTKYMFNFGGGRSISIMDIWTYNKGKSTPFNSPEEAEKAAMKIADDWTSFLEKYDVDK